MVMHETRTPLQGALETFEAALETPLISGELEAWSDSVQAACAEAVERWQEEVQNEHPVQFKQIRREDLELGPRIEKLQEEDAAISEQVCAYCNDLEALVRRAGDIEPDEKKFAYVYDEIVRTGIALVIRMRTQQQAIRTWFLEAFDRDRGTAD